MTPHFPDTMRTVSVTRFIQRLSEALVLLMTMSPAIAEPLKINGSTMVNLPEAEAAEVLRAEKGMKIQIDTQGGSSGGISMLGVGLVQIGMASKPPGAADRKKYPD